MESASSSGQTASSSTTISENQNWYNTSSAYSFPLPSVSGWINGGTVDGKTWTTTESYTISGLLDSGYGAPVNAFYVNGSRAYPSSSDYSVKGTGISGTVVIISSADFVNYDPTVTNISTGLISGSTARLSFSTSEQIAEKEDISISWGDGSSTILSGVSPGIFSETHAFSSNQTGSFSTTYTISIQVTNLPNGDPVNPSSLSTTKTTDYTVSISPSLLPSAYSTLSSGEYIGISWIAGGLNVNSVSLTVNGLNEIPTENSSTHYSYLSPSAGLTTLRVVWKLAAGSITDSIEATYSSLLYPTDLSNYLSVGYGSQATRSYAISISSPVSGSGNYVQALNITNSSLLAGLNSEGSNFLVTLANGTPLASWIVSFNGTELEAGATIPKGTSNVLIDLLPTYERYAKSGPAVTGSSPSISVTGDTFFQAASNTTNQEPFTTFSEFQYNESLGTYTYDLTNYYYSNFVTIYYNSSWTFSMASPSHAFVLDTRDHTVTFYDVSEISSFKVVFVEPIQIARPYATVSLDLQPSSVLQFAGAQIPPGLLKIYVDGIQLPSGAVTYQAVLGQTYNVTVKDSFGDILASANVTANTQEYSYSLTVPLSQFQLFNGNMSENILAYVIEGGQPYFLGASAFYQPLSILIPNANYEFKYVIDNLSNEAQISVSRENYTISGYTFSSFNGISLFSLQQDIFSSRSNESNLIDNINIAISNTNSSLHNEIVNVNFSVSNINSNISSIKSYQAAYFDALNSSISNVSITGAQHYNIINSSLGQLTFNDSQYFTLLNSSLDSLNLTTVQQFSLLNTSLKSNYINLVNNLSFINDTIRNNNVSVQVKLQYYYSVIESDLVNANTRIRYTDTLINTSKYTLVFGHPQHQGDQYDFPVYVKQGNGTGLANITITRDAVQNLRVTYALKGAVPLGFSTSDIKPGFFDLELNLTPAEIGQLDNGSFIAVSSPVISGGANSTAFGEIVASSIPAASQPWYEKYFGISSPPPGGAGDFSWFILSVPGILSTGVLGAIILLFYTRNLVHGLRVEKQQREDAEKQKKEFEDMRKDIKDLKKQRATKNSDGGD